MFLHGEAQTIVGWQMHTKNPIDENGFKPNAGSSGALSLFCGIEKISIV